MDGERTKEETKERIYERKEGKDTTPTLIFNPDTNRAKQSCSRVLVHAALGPEEHGVGARGGEVLQEVRERGGGAVDFGEEDLCAFISTHYRGFGGKSG
jgi:hypothetical protein